MSQEPVKQVIVVGSSKSVGIAILLTVLFGPLGMLYSTVTGAIVMIVVGVIPAFCTAGFSLFITWPICVIWGAVAASSHNKKLLAAGSMAAMAPTPVTGSQTAAPQPAESRPPASTTTEAPITTPAASPETVAGPRTSGATTTTPLAESPAFNLGKSLAPVAVYLMENKEIATIAIAAGLFVVVCIAAVNLFPGSKATSTFENITSSPAQISTTDLAGTIQRAVGLFTERDTDLAQTTQKTSGNEIAFAKEIAQVHQRHFRRITEEFAKLQDRQVQWRFTVANVDEDFIRFKEAPNTGYVWPNDSSNPFFIWFDEATGAPGYFHIKKHLTRAFVEKLRLGDSLLVKAKVDANVYRPRGSDTSIRVSLTLTDIEVEGTNAEKPPTRRPANVERPNIQAANLANTTARSEETQSDQGPMKPRRPTAVAPVHKTITSSTFDNIQPAMPPNRPAAARQEIPPVVVAAESFDYAPGAAEGSTGGKGFKSLYTGSGKITAGSLNYTDSHGAACTVSGNRFTTPGMNEGVFRFLATRDLPAGLVDDNNKFGRDGSVVYVAFLCALASGDNTGYGCLSLYDNDDERLAIGDAGYPNRFNWGIDIKQSGPRGVFESRCPVDTTSHLLVARIDFRPEGESIRLYVDPPLSAEPSNPTMGPLDTPDFHFNRIRLMSGPGNGGTPTGGTHHFDEIRIGTSWSVVTRYQPPQMRDTSASVTAPLAVAQPRPDTPPSAQESRMPLPQGADDKALADLRAKAESGDYEAQRHLGTRYAKGEGVPKDEVEAAKWYRKAADQNRPAAQKALAYCYADGTGVTKDEVEAYKWWLLSGSGESGRVTAKKKERMATLERSLSPEQLTEAKRRADEWRKQHDVKPESNQANVANTPAMVVPSTPTPSQADSPRHEESKTGTQPSTLAPGRTDLLEIVSMTPPSPAVLKVGEKMEVRIRYSKDSREPVLIWAMPYTDGRATSGSTFGQQQRKVRNGEVSGWFSLKDPATVDEVRITMANAETREVIKTISQRIQAQWRADAGPKLDLKVKLPTVKLPAIKLP